MGKRRFLWFGGAVLLTLAAVGYFVSLGNGGAVPIGFVKDHQDSSRFYRMRVGLSHEGERIDFDIVVGCAIRVTNYIDGDRSFDARHYPATYMKRIEGGHGVLLRIPRYCDGWTTDNGKVPEDMVPPIVWYEDADDWIFGTGYYSMDAYENPNAQLEFHGASVHAAKREEFEAALPQMQSDNLVPQDGYAKPRPHPTEAEKKAHSWDKQWLARWFPFVPRCYGVRRFDLTDEAANELLRAHWPDHKPRFWSLPQTPQSNELPALTGPLWRLNDKRGPRVGEHYLNDYYKPREHQSRGFPGPSGEATWPAHRPYYTATYYPAENDTALPWVTKEKLETRELSMRYLVDSEEHKGFLYCHAALPKSDDWNAWYGDNYYPESSEEMPCLAAGEGVYWPNQRCTVGPSYFFENDTTIFINTIFY